VRGHAADELLYLREIRRGRGLGDLEHQAGAVDAVLGHGREQPLEELRVRQRRARQVDRHAQRPRRAAVLAELFEGAFAHGAIDLGKDLVARGGRHEIRGLDQVALAVDDAHQQLVGHRQRAVDQRRDRLREHHDAVEPQGFAHAADEADLIVPADHALVGVLVDLDAATAAVLGGLAGDLRLGDAMVEVQVRRRGRHRAPRHGNGVVRLLARERAARVAHFAADAVGELARLRQVHVRQEHREAVAGQAAGEAVRADQRAPDGATAAPDDLVTVGEAREVVDEMQAIDVAVQQRHHGRGRRGAHPGVHARLEAVPGQQPGERVEVLRGAACQQPRETRQAAHREFVEAGLVGPVEDDQRAGGAAARDQRHGHQLAGDGSATGMLELVGGDRLARVADAAREFFADDAELFAREGQVFLAASPDRARFLAREHRGGRRAPQAQANRRKTLSLLRSGTTTESSDVFSADLTDYSTDLVLLLWAAD
jgi:hypothetical protein